MFCSEWLLILRGGKSVKSVSGALNYFYINKLNSKLAFPSLHDFEIRTKLNGFPQGYKKLESVCHCLNYIKLNLELRNIFSKRYIKWFTSSVNTCFTCTNVLEGFVLFRNSFMIMKITKQMVLHLCWMSVLWCYFVFVGMAEWLDYILLPVIPTMANICWHEKRII